MITASQQAEAPATSAPQPANLTTAKSQKQKKARKTAASLVTKKKATTKRSGTKTAKILSLLERSGGASMAELMKTTKWQAHSVRGFLSGTIKRKMRLKLTSAKREDGERAYRVIAK